MTIPGYISLTSLGQVTVARARRLVGAGRQSDSIFCVTPLTDPSIRVQIRALLNDFAQVAGQAQVLSDDPWQVIWNAEQTCYVPFLEEAFTLVAFRDPVGPAEQRQPLLGLFKKYALSLGKHALILAASPEAFEASKAYQYGAFWLGTEQFYDLSRFSTSGKSGKRLRKRISYAKRHDAEVREIFPLQDETVRQDILKVDAVWKAARAERKNPSFMRTAPLENPEQHRYFGVYRSADDGLAMQGFLVCSPISKRGWYLEDMVRRPDAITGIMEMALAFAIDTFRTEGFQFASMGWLPCYRPDGAPRQVKVPFFAQLGLNWADERYGFSRLGFFRNKFSPTAVEDNYILYWPPILMPFTVWDTVSVIISPSG